MAHLPTVEEILPMVDALSVEDRVRLLRMISRSTEDDALIYAALPPSAREFSSDDDPLSWESDGWEDVGEPGRDPLVHLSSPGQAAARVDSVSKRNSEPAQ